MFTTQKRSASSPESYLKKEIVSLLYRFPSVFDERLKKGLVRVVANSSHGFVSERSLPHLRRLLLAQFFLQKRIEECVKSEHPSIFLKLFSSGFRLCVNLVHFSPQNEEFISSNQLLKELQVFIPGLIKIPHSFFSWLHPESAYRFYYFEVQKTRGKSLTNAELKEIEKALRKKLLCMSMRRSIFWPYNEEESYRQLLALKKELSHKDDFPQVSIHFQGQTSTFLEFLIHMVSPKKDPFYQQCVKRIPSSVRLVTYLQKTSQDLFPIESRVFSIQVPLDQFLDNNEINLIHARRIIVRYLKDIVGPFRDFNGGLLEVQQKHFEQIKRELSEKIPHFNLFAERLYYSIKPIESQVCLSLEVAEALFSAFSEVLEKKGETEVLDALHGISIFKKSAPTLKLLEFPSSGSAYLELSDFHYYCFINKSKTQDAHFLDIKPTNVLRLSFMDAAPISLNPWCIYLEIRGRIICKALYEGLTRIDATGNPILAGAESCQLSEDGLTYLFKIRKHHWSNGEKVIAFHYERSWKAALLALDMPPEPFFVIKNGQKIKEKKLPVDSLGIKALDEKTLRIELERPDPFFLEKLSHPFFFPLLTPSEEPKHFNGPYVPLNKDDKTLSLEYNPYYWDHEKIFFQQIHITWEKNINEIYQAFLDGDIDWIGTPFCSLPFHLLQSLEEKREVKQKIVSRVLGIYFNTNQPPFNSPLVRFAFHAAIDRSFVKNSIFPNELILQSLLPVNQSCFAFPLDQPDPTVLRRMFLKGLRELGINKRNLTPIRFSYYHAAGHKQLALYLKERWETLFEVPVFLKALQWNELYSELSRGAFEVAECTSSALCKDPLELLQRFENKNSPFNFSKWSHPLFQEKISSIRSASTLQDKQRYLQEAEEHLYKEMPFIPIVNRKCIYSIAEGLKNYVIDETGCVDFRWAEKIQEDLC